MRADQLLVERGMAPTRSAAQRLIATGAVRWRAPAGWRVPAKAGEDLPSGAEVEITDDAELRFVSRGGLKLDGALARLGIEVAGMTCLDLGGVRHVFACLLRHCPALAGAPAHAAALDQALRRRAARRHAAFDEQLVRPHRAAAQ